MNSEAPTPETDEVAKKCRSYKEMGTDFNGMVMHAKKLERERNEAIREAERWRDYFKTGMSMQIKAPSQIFPWENAHVDAPAHD